MIVPVPAAVSADVTLPASSDTLAKDNPEVIAALKTHVAYVGQSQDARMDGVIGYIDTISNGEGSHSLREIREDYLIIASSIPVMQTADDIAEARLGLQRQSRLFAEETRAQLLLFNGSTDAMREQAAKRVEAVENSATSLTDSLWLAKETARLTIFNRESEQREALLRGLSRQGIDVSRAANISQQIDAKRSDLQSALSARSVPALAAVNTGLRPLNAEFRKTVEEYRAGRTIELKRAAILAMG
jgi:hypothetical protein